MDINTPYLIRIKGHLDQRWLRWFENFEITYLPEGDSLIRGIIIDQAALFGLLILIRDLGMELLLVQRLENPNEKSCEDC